MSYLLIFSSSVVIMLGIYVHIPFCVRKCGYCDFYSIPVSGGAIPVEEYLAAVLAQMRRDAPLFAGRRIDSVYFGGGTPSLMPPAFLGEVLGALRSMFKCTDSMETSCEVNPATADAEWFCGARARGTNRCSIGVQSFQDRILGALGRPHSSEEAMRAIAEAQEAGFDSVSIDLMYGNPGQSVSELEDDVRIAMTFRPQHISAYQLTLEEGTPLYDRLSKSGVRDSGFGIRDWEVGGRENILPSPESRVPSPESLPSDDCVLEQMRIVARMLSRGGWQRYEISNFARPGFECRHNVNCWRYGEYLGLGAGAASFLRYGCSSGLGTRDSGLEIRKHVLPDPESRVPSPGFARRWTQIRDVNSYMAGSLEPAEDERIDLRTAMAEFCIMALRTARGISPAEFERLFGEAFEGRFGREIGRLAGEGMVRHSGGTVSLTERGLELSNQVFHLFLP